MRQSTGDLDEVRRRSDLAQIVSAYVTLRRSGARLVGLCPFHEETAPSFSIDPNKQLWHCFGCKAGGDVFSFVQKIENLDFMEAARWLARKAGVTLKETGSASRSEREVLAQVNEQAASFYEKRLRSPAGQVCGDYLKERGLTDDVIERFRIGFAPAGWEELFSHLRMSGSSARDIAAAGLCLPRQRAPGHYDRFRNRVMFPICDAEGRVIGFGGRLMPGAEDQGPTTAKYLNSPETALFRKGRALYGLNLARKAFQERQRAIVVEGYFDCVACHQAGLAEAAATMGTALTPDQAMALRRYVERIVLAFDADSAGFAATLRSVPLFARAGLSARVARFAGGLDPDAYRQEKGSDALRQSVEEAVPLLECRLRILEELHAKQGEDGRQQFMKEAVEALAELTDPLEQAHWVRWLAERQAAQQVERADLLEQAIWQAVRQKGKGQGPAPARRGTPVTGRQLAERQVLAAMLSTDVLARNLCERLHEDLFLDQANREIFAAMRSLLEQGQEPGAENVRSCCGPQSAERVVELQMEHEPLQNEALDAVVERLEEWRTDETLRSLRARAERGELLDPTDAAYAEIAAMKRQLSQKVGRRSQGTQGN